MKPQKNTHIRPTPLSRLLKRSCQANLKQGVLGLAPSFDTDLGIVRLTRATQELLRLIAVHSSDQDADQIVAAFKSEFGEGVTRQQTVALLDLSTDVEMIQMADDFGFEIDVYPTGEAWSFVVGFPLRWIGADWVALGEGDAVVARGTFVATAKAAARISRQRELEARSNRT